MDVTNSKEKLVIQAYSTCDNMIDDLKRGKLESQAGCTPEETLEAKITKELSKVCMLRCVVCVCVCVCVRERERERLDAHARGDARSQNLKGAVEGWGKEIRRRRKN